MSMDRKGPRRSLTDKLKKPACFLQGVISFTALGLAVWSVVSIVKKMLLWQSGTSMYPWTFVYYRPTEYDLPNYLVLCVFMGSAGLLFYLLNTERWRSYFTQTAEQSSPPVVLGSLALSLALFAASYQVPGTWRLLILTVVIALPFVSMGRPAWEKATFGSKKETAFFSLLTVLIFLALCAEVLQFFFHPVYLLNEFPEISTHTKIDRESRVVRTVRNDEYLEKLGNDELRSVFLFFDIYSRLGGKYTEYFMADNFDFLADYRLIDMRLPQSYIVELINASRPDMVNFLMSSREYRQSLSMSRADIEKYLSLIPKTDVETVKQFYLNNFIEYWHWNIGRGQLNHIGHILNPLNEYLLGRPVNDIYFQYGLGNSLLFKWVMDFFGGISFENFYKVNILYVFYYLAFILMLFFVFDDLRYILASALVIPVSFYFMGYIFMIMGPGHIPSRHLLDVPVMVLLTLFFRGKKLFPVFLCALLVPLSIFLNLQFGIILLVSFSAALFLFIAEHGKELPSARGALLLGVGAVCVSLAAYRFLGGLTNNDYFTYFLRGFFAWPSNRALVLATILYLASSYAFIALIRKDRDELKYLSIFVFLYAQGILVYYFWNGLLNHVYPAVPFCWLQLMLTVRILSRKGASLGRMPERMIHALPSIVAAGMLIILPLSMLSYYGEKLKVEKYFRMHTLYAWPFGNARVLTSTSPALVMESVDLIGKYSDQARPGIYMISKYDNILPFLAGRYSLMPVFELSSFLFSKRESDRVKDLLKKNRPEYLFVDTSIHHYHVDPWSKVYNGSYMRMERAARLNKYSVLEGIFSAVEKDYVKVEQGRLLTVYQRKT